MSRKYNMCVETSITLFEEADALEKKMKMFKILGMKSKVETLSRRITVLRETAEEYVERAESYLAAC